MVSNINFLMKFFQGESEQFYTLILLYLYFTYNNVIIITKSLFNQSTVNKVNVYVTMVHNK